MSPKSPVFWCTSGRLDSRGFWQTLLSFRSSVEWCTPVLIRNSNKMNSAPVSFSLHINSYQEVKNRTSERQRDASSASKLRIARNAAGLVRGCPSMPELEETRFVFAPSRGERES